MEVIQSFQIDHTCLKPGIYVSRQDKGFITFDLRFTEPNKEPAMHPNAVHTLEHLGATYFRNSDIKDSVVYFGPMGCLTGFYLILSGEHTIDEVRDFIEDCLDFITNFEGEVPGAKPEMCGNYLLHDLPTAKLYAKKYLKALEEDFNCEYVRFERKAYDGKVFHDA